MGTRLFIGGLNFRTVEEDLAAYISAVAPIAPRERRSRDGESEPVVERMPKIMRDPNMDNRSKGFGFVEMETEEGAQLVINELNGKEFEGRRLNIDFARERERQSFSGGNTFGGGRNDAPQHGENSFPTDRNYSQEPAPVPTEENE